VYSLSRSMLCCDHSCQNRPSSAMVLTCRQLHLSAPVERRARPRIISMDVWRRARSLIFAVALCLIATPLVAQVVARSAVQPVLVLDIPVDFILLALTLIGGTIALGILRWNPDPPRKVELRSAHIIQVTLGDVS
jgi:hypothetical protein